MLNPVIEAGDPSLEGSFAAMTAGQGTAGLRIAVLLPCYNEELTVADTIAQFQSALPNAAIVVCDNNSTDRTAERAVAAGAKLIREPRQGKGNAVRRLFSSVDADIYVLADGDCTYDATSAPRLVQHMCTNNLDFLNAARVTDHVGAYRAGHRLGNYVLSNLVHYLFRSSFSDMLSGYKLLSRRFVRSFPSMSSGFEIETELTVHALELRMVVDEVASPYEERPEGSYSKLRTFKDGSRILLLITNLLRRERPMLFFGVLGALLLTIAVLLGLPLVSTYLETGLVPRLPTAVLVVGLGIAALLCLFAGLILDTVTTSRHEMKRLAYLSVPSLRQVSAPAGGGE